MKVRKVQDDRERDVLLVVHDETGNASNIINSLYTLLQDLARWEQTGEIPLCPDCNGNKVHPDDSECTSCLTNILSRYGFQDED